MNLTVGVLFAMIFLYVVTPLVLWALISKFLRVRPGELRLGLVVGLSVAPIFIGMLVMMSYRRFPDRGDWFYVIAPMVVIFIIGVICKREVACLPQAIRDILKTTRERLSLASGGLIAIFMAALVLIGAFRAAQNTLSIAILDTDALEYATLGRHIERKESLRFYPMLKADDRTGFYTPCTHPLTYPSLLAWNYQVQRDNWSFGYGRLIGLWAMVSMSVSLMYLTRRQPIHLSLLSVLGMYSCPALFNEFSNMSIDPLYLAPLLGCLAVIVESMNTPNWRNAILTGVMLGSMAAVHSIGLYLFAVVGVAAFLLIRTTWRRRFVWAGLACMVGLTLCADTYLRNMRVRGRPLGDDVAVWDLKVVSFQEFVRTERGLITMSDRLVKGVLRVWHEPGNYGLLPWLIVIALLASLKKNGWRLWQWPDGMKLALVVFALYHLGIVLSWLVGVDLLIKNFRYQLPMVLMMAVAIPFVISYQGFAGTISISAEARLSVVLRKIGFTVLYIFLAALVFEAGGVNQSTQWLEKIALPKDTRMARESTYGALVVLRQYEVDASPDSRLLSFSTNYPAFYSKKPILSELDPAMSAFYLSKSMEEARGFLREHGITHILATPYYWPTFDRTLAKRIFEDKEACEIIAESEGWRLAKVKF